jgi:type II secretion system (T2SS) protein B
VSYILDALTKAAQQRDRRIPVIQRLLAPAARVPRLPWTRSLGRLVVVLALNAVLLTGLIFWWLQPLAEPPVPTPAAVAPATAPPIVEATRSAAAPRSSVEPARSAIVEPARPVAEPQRSAIAAPPSKAAPRVEGPASAGRSMATAPPAPVVAPQAPPSVPVPTPQRPVPSPQSPPIASVPFTPVAPAIPPSPGRPALKLEALIYSDVPSQRMVFINGRRYVEGDTVDGRLRVEEIHEDGVDLSEQGRRTTLRATR